VFGRELAVRILTTHRVEEMDSDDNDDDDDIIVGDVEAGRHDDNDNNDDNDESSNDDASEDDSYDDAEVLVYTGARGEIPPHKVVRVFVDPSVTSIPARAFFRRTKLAEVELCEGLVEIGEDSFRWCYHSITKINVPTSLRRINNWAFNYSLRCPIRLHDGIESIGTNAFGYCIFTNFRVPPLITVIPKSMLMNCRAMFSLELSDNMTEIKNGAFGYCYCLRNVAFPPNADIDYYIFIEVDDDVMTDLQRLFGNSNANIIWELQHRFDGLPIHSIVYYQSYNQGVLQNLLAAINMTSGQSQSRSKLDPTGNQQDCLGMTPLHILACSSVHNIEVYRVIVENYPTNLITKDRWGVVPLLYAFWGAAPAEIIQFLLDSYQLYFPNHVFYWTMMVETMGRTDTPKESIENLLCVKEMHFPSQPIDWEYLLEMFAQPSCVSFYTEFRERMQFLFKCGLSSRVEALAFKVWRDHITNMIHTAVFEYDEDNFVILQRIRDKIAYFEDEVLKLKEATTTLELALWKARMTVNENIHQEVMYHCQKKVKIDESSVRKQCRVACGADVVIVHVLPFLISDEYGDW
jgi:hypothetical protein